MTTFQRIVHSDWSKHPQGRWCASARRTASGWRAAGPWPVGDVDGFVARLVAFGRTGPTLAAFDFPIGLPTAYAGATGFPGFRKSLDALGGPGWERWFEPAATAAEIGPRRPLYPARPGGTRVSDLVAGLGVGGIGDLLRRCDRGTPPAGCMFWLVGAKTVGKAAIHGWQEAIRPAVAQGATLWPFDGDLPALAAGGGLVLAESYPADALHQLGLALRGKTDPEKLAALGPALAARASDRGIALSAGLADDIADGFRRHRGRCGDAFDAVVGLLAAIAVADGERSDGAPETEAVRTWEGWILGRQASPGIPAAAGAFKAGGDT